MRPPFDDDPRSWNEIRFPWINLQLINFPAFILPLAGSFICVFTKTYRGSCRPPQGPLLRKTQPDRIEHIQREANPPAAAPELDWYVARSLDIFHYFTIWKALYYGNISWHGNDSILCFSEALALVLEGFVFCRSNTLSCSLTALGWAAFRFRRDSSSIDMWLLVILALPCAWQVLGSTQRGPQSSGTLLLAHACDGLLPPLSFLRRHSVAPLTADWQLVVWLISAFIADVIVKKWRSAEEEPHRGPNRFVLALSNVLGGLPIMLARTVTLMSLLAASVCITGFAFSCLNWRFLLYGLRSRPPVLDMTALVAGQLALVPAMIHMYLKQDEERKHQDVFDWSFFFRMAHLFADSIGWAVTLFVTLWGVLTALAAYEPQIL